MILPIAPNPGEGVKAATMQDIIDFARRATPISGPGTRVSRTPGGSLIVGTATGGVVASGLKPFTVRRHQPDPEDTNSGQWEIWLPPGCVSVGDTCQPINLPAKDISGHEDDKIGWYVLPVDPAEGQAHTDTSTLPDDTQVTDVWREWQITVHAKTSAGLTGADPLAATGKRYFYVATRKRQEPGESAPAHEATDNAGDELAIEVGTLRIGARTVGDGDPDDYRRYTHRQTSPIIVAGKERAAFDLVWWFSLNDDATLKLDHVYCVRNSMSAAGTHVEGPQMTEVTDAAATIYAKITTNPFVTNKTANQIEVLIDPSGMRASNDLTWLHLYDMEKNVAKADYRSQSLVNAQFYR